MTLSLLLYGGIMGLTLGTAAHFLDRGARTLGRPTRGIWATAMIFTLIAPGLPLILPQAQAAPAPTGSPLPLEFFYQMATLGAGPTGPGLSPGEAFMVVWGVGSLLILTLVLWTAFRLRRAAGGWETAYVGEEEVLVSHRLGPAVVGFFRPRIVLPRPILTLNSEELEVILLHEAEHRTARDPALLGGGILLAALSPWNIALWWMLRRLKLAVEGDCDARVLSRGIGRRRYGAVLVRIASEVRGSWVLAPALAEGRTSFLERRLQMMKESVRGNRRWSALGAALVGGGLLFLACETPVPPTTVEPEMDVTASPIQGVAEPEATGVPVTPETVKLVSEDGSTVTGDLIAINGSRNMKIRPIGEDEAQPLVIIDGVIISSELNWTELIDKEDIESVEVIKGGAAKALYGDRAANGLIRITTKH